MTGSFSKILFKIRASFWFIPSFYGVLAFVLAVVCFLIDVSVPSMGHAQWMRDWLLTDIALAQTLLGAISASLLTMTTITFSSIMVVLTTYLSQFSPRTLQDFMMDHSTQRVLGVFIGGFIYSTLLLLLLRERYDDDALFISPALAVVVAFICVGFFVFFIHHVGNWIQVSNLIHHICADTIKSIDKNFNEETHNHKDAPWEDWESEEITQMEPKEIQSIVSGYLQLIDIEDLVEKAKADNCIIKLEKRLGDYVDKGSTLLLLYNLEGNKIETDYLTFFSFGSERATIQDVEFGITKIVEIGLRALSPGINDPNTAISCIRQLGKILARLGNKNLHRSFFNDDKRSLRLIIEQPSFSDYLYKSFYQIRQYSSEDISVLAAIIEALQVIAEQNNGEIKKEIWDFSRYILEALDHQLLLELDRNYMNRKLERLAQRTGFQKDFIPI
ncbi:DUF2254 domain-containing protein [Desertibacillus haloalkaliphilus]|uniref:DUF2254 domain-containing protein n=1 Tax=Desertibacillus haloalkaliphilus TaxID=1328930 RepID=UPI001C28035E|nr:DUF2254 domain-containing protein [Desertibacillus haloalkaliphilus]MBU8906109.1 DUF2254 domain-containing protein [Desertibacillus haloalkaliphilus]